MHYLLPLNRKRTKKCGPLSDCQSAPQKALKRGNYLTTVIMCPSIEMIIIYIVTFRCMHAYCHDLVWSWLGSCVSPWRESHRNASNLFSCYIFISWITKLFTDGWALRQLLLILADLFIQFTKNFFKFFFLFLLQVFIYK